MIFRERLLENITRGFETHSAVALLGPRQCGKTTLAKLYRKDHPQHQTILNFDLENPEDLLMFENPMLPLKRSFDLAIIDEIQRVPDLFPTLRYLIDQEPHKKYLILGSASRDLIHQSSETLAGRLAFLEITPFSLDEVQPWMKLWVEGGYPKAFLSTSAENAAIWLKQYVTSFLERDIPALGIKIPAQTLRRFWAMLAHYHGNMVNLSELGRSMGLTHVTIRNYLEILEGTFMIRLLKPWHENLKKRQVKTPKLYFRDTGLLHILLGLNDEKSLLTHPKVGASWEGFALEQIIRILEVDPNDCYFWGTHREAELDLLIHHQGKKIGFEFKYAQAPKPTPSLKLAQEDLKLDHAFIVYPGEKSGPLSDSLSLLSIQDVKKNLLTQV